MAFLCHGKNVLQVSVNLFLMRFFVMRHEGGFFAPPCIIELSVRFALSFLIRYSGVIIFCELVFCVRLFVWSISFISRLLHNFEKPLVFSNLAAYINSP